MVHCCQLLASTGRCGFGAAVEQGRRAGSSVTRGRDQAVGRIRVCARMADWSGT